EPGLLRRAVGLSEDLVVDALGVVERVEDVDEDVAEPPAIEQPARLLDRATDGRVVAEVLLLAVGEDLDGDDHPPAIGLADEALQPLGHLGPEAAVAAEAVEPGVLVRPAAVAALDRDADEVDPVRDHIIKIINMPLRHSRAVERVPASEAPEVDRLAAEI